MRPTRLLKQLSFGRRPNSERRSTYGKRPPNRIRRNRHDEHLRGGRPGDQSQDAGHVSDVHTAPVISNAPAFFGPLGETGITSTKCSSAPRPEVRCYVQTRVEPGTPRAGGRWSASIAPGQARALQQAQGASAHRSDFTCLQGYWLTVCPTAHVRIPKLRRDRRVEGFKTSDPGQENGQQSVVLSVNCVDGTDRHP
jgi:hypothetical protein